MSKRKHDLTRPGYIPAPQPTAPQNMLEVVRYEHKGIVVYVKIDYLNSYISLVNDTDWTTKKWVFAQRSLEYMQGWKNILEAMKLAVEFAETKLRLRNEEMQEEFRDKMVEFALQKDFGKLKQA